MRCHKQKAFTVIELLIGISIVVLLATITVFELRTSKRSDELKTATRQFAADLRAAQSNALAAKSVKACETAASDLAVCEFDTASCGVNPCEDRIPAAYGVFVTTGTSTYSIFTDINPVSGTDFRYTDSGEVYESHNLLLLGSQDVVIEQIFSSSTAVASASVSFMRQNGKVRINNSATPPEPAIIRFILKHTITNKTAEVQVNSVTGRISIL